MNDKAMQMFSPQDLKQRVTDSVRASFGMLIPDEQFQALVDKEVDAFFNTEDQVFTLVDVPSQVYGTPRQELRAKISPFRQMVWMACVQEVKPVFEAMRQSGDFQVTLVRNFTPDGMTQLQAELSEQHKEELRAALPEIGVRMFSGMFAELYSSIGAQTFNKINESLSQRGIR